MTDWLRVLSIGGSFFTMGITVGMWVFTHKRMRRQIRSLRRVVREDHRLLHNEVVPRLEIARVGGDKPFTRELPAYDDSEDLVAGVG
jgi:hypothetical protein